MSSPDDKTVIAPKSSGPGGPQDADRTVVTQSAALSANAQHALPAGTRLGEFEIVDLIGEGGFGIVYLAYDTQLGRNVALKEYIPAALAARVGTSEVSVRSERHEDTFRAGLKSFINEARLLARFDHHSLVKVYRFWEANGTAYMVMPYYEGITLRDGLRRMPAPPDEAWLTALLTPLIEALAVLHASQCYHRDIAPDNIMLLHGSGRPVLLDFGAARRVIGDMTQALTVILKPGYAPVEQYAEVAAMKQGPWTDVYALGAVVYFAIQGKTPPPSVGRLMSDTYVPLASAAAGRYTDRFLRAIDHALAVRPEHRPQSVEALASELGISIDAPAHEASGAPAHAPAAVAGTDSRTGTLRTTQTTRKEAGTAIAQPPSADAAAGNRRKRAGLIAAGVCLVALVATGIWFATRPPPPVTAVKATTPPETVGIAASSQPSSSADTRLAAPDNAAQNATAPIVQPEARAPATVAETPAPLASISAPAASLAGNTLDPFTPGGELDSRQRDTAQHDCPDRPGPTAIPDQQQSQRLRLRLSRRSGGRIHDAVSQWARSQQQDRRRSNAVAAATSLVDAGGRPTRAKPVSGAGLDSAPRIFRRWHETRSGFFNFPGGCATRRGHAAHPAIFAVRGQTPLRGRHDGLPG
jgi:serine/threonine protein kinase